MIVGGNGFGKSAIIKSLYQTLGALPHKIDGSWSDANVASALVLDCDGETYTVVRALGMYALFDANREIVFSARTIVDDWGVKLADFFGFRLIMNDRDGNVVTPPPGYMFAPFYVDQDASWNRPWVSFKDLYLPDSARTLADYHSGLRSDEYYIARANIAAEKLKLTELEASIATLRDSMAKIQGLEEGATPTIDIDVFAAEIEEFVAESNSLLTSQLAYRNSITELGEEAHLLRAEKALLQRTLQEVAEEFEVAAALPDIVDCPTCGHGHENNLVDRFALIADTGVISEAIGDVTAKLAGLAKREMRLRADLAEIERAIGRIERILRVRNDAMSFGDAVMAAGKTEAAKVLRKTLTENLEAAKLVYDDIAKYRRTMSDLTSRKRTGEILRSYRSKLTEFAHVLDVRLDGRQNQPINSILAARGSEGPRGLLAYYYAFLHTRARFSTSAIWPIVIDAPNQQGQDFEHLPRMQKFIFDQAPAGHQVIVATEVAGDEALQGVETRRFGERKRQVLRDEEYEDVNERFSVYIERMIAVSPETKST